MTLRIKGKVGKKTTNKSKMANNVSTVTQWVSIIPISLNVHFHEEKGEKVPRALITSVGLASINPDRKETNKLIFKVRLDILKRSCRQRL